MVRSEESLTASPGSVPTPAYFEPACWPTSAFIVDERVYLRSPLLCRGAVGGERAVAIHYRLEGPLGAPVLVALGGISADRHVVTTDDGGPGWWQTLFARDQAINTQEFRVLSFDFLGGNGSSHGPRNSEDDQDLMVTTHDQARVLAELLNFLGVEQIFGFIGASYGGMVALAFAELFPDRVKALLVVSAAHKPAPLASALRTLQRRIVALGAAHQDTGEGLKLARALAMTTYRTTDEFHARFSTAEHGSDFLDADQHEAWAYLEARGHDYVQRMHPQAFLNLSRSIDLHRVRPEALRTPLHLVSIDSDQCVPLILTNELAQRAPTLVAHHVFSSLYGHDAFLKETASLGQVFLQFSQAIG